MQVVIGLDAGNDTVKVCWAFGETVNGFFNATQSGITSFANEIQMHYSFDAYRSSSNHKNGRSMHNRGGQVIEWGDYVIATGTEIAGNVGLVKKIDFSKYSDDYYLPILASALAYVAKQSDKNEALEVYLFSTCQITGKSDVAAWIKANAPKIKRIKTLDKSYSIKIMNIVVHAEPVGTAINFLWATHDLPYRQSDYLVLDFGGLTTDALRFQASGNDANTISNTSYVTVPFSCNQLVREVKKYLTKVSREYNDNTPDYLIVKAIKDGEIYGVADLDKTIQEMKGIVGDFLETVVSSLEKALGGRNFKSYDKLLLTGGGATMLGDYFEAYDGILAGVLCPAEEFAFNNVRGAFAVYKVRQ